MPSSSFDPGPAQLMPAALTAYDAAHAALLARIAPVAPIELPCDEALGCVVADAPVLHAVPAADVAATDGFAFRASEIVGASSYSPLPLTTAPIWVEAGDRMPAGCDCVVDAELVETFGSTHQVCGDAIPGEGVRRAGADLVGGALRIDGLRAGALDLLATRIAGVEHLSVRRPQCCVIDIPATNAVRVTAGLIAQQAREAGGEVMRIDAAGRDASAIAQALEQSRCDLIVTIGGTGIGRTDATIAAIAQRAELIARGIAMQPGRTTALGMIGRTPVIALPGAPDQALAAWLTLALPAFDRLAGRRPRPTVSLPLARKIASSVGIAELVLLANADGAWMPLAAGELSLDAIARADAWFLVPGNSEGYARGMPIDACPLRDQS